MIEVRNAICNSKNNIKQARTDPTIAKGIALLGFNTCNSCLFKTIKCKNNSPLDKAANTPCKLSEQNLLLKLYAYHGDEIILQ